MPFHLPGDIFGLETGIEHRFAAEAIQEVKVRAFRHRDLKEKIATDPAAISDLMLAMANSLERAQDHMLLLGRKCAREKIATFLLRISGRISNKRTIELSMSRTDIADHLGLTIETVSRTLTQLQRENVIEIRAVGAGSSFAILPLSGKWIPGTPTRTSAYRCGIAPETGCYIEMPIILPLLPAGADRWILRSPV